MTTEHAHEPSASGVIRHLVRCRPCRDSLATMGSGDGVVAFLEAQRDATDVTTLDRVLASTATAGRRVVADLVYELAKGCLLSDEEFARLVKPVVAPRDVEVVRAELEQSVARAPALDALGVADVCRLAERSLADRDEVLVVGESLLTMLEALEGASPRKVIANSQFQVTRGQHDAACESLSHLIADANVSDLHRQLAAIGTARARFVTGRHEDVRAIVHAAMEDGYCGPILTLYQVASDVAEGKTDSATSQLEHLCMTKLRWTSADRAQVECMAPYIAGGLGIETDELTSRLGAA